MDYDKLERLVNLRDSGALTEQEFIEEKILLTAPTHKVISGLTRTIKGHKFKIMALAGCTVALLGLGVLLHPQPTAISDFFDPNSTPKRQCQAAIKTSLINPETVQFYEFTPEPKELYLTRFEELTRDEYKEVAEKSISDSNLYEVYAQGMSSATEIIISNAVTEAVSRERARLVDEGRQTFTLRFKAEGKLGNKITSTEHCAVNKISCECI